MATFRDLLSDARSRITETDPAGAEALLAGGHLLLDVREPDEFEQGAIPDSMHIPR
ncbi:MAG: molybdopterin biosynthesis protein MoeB, partial [Acidimicrobiaceae bacterium]|nr:molybdopterin biosynthesis protein MoeB [Acidimicrobiaceae bacterium]